MFEFQKRVHNDGWRLKGLWVYSKISLWTLMHLYIARVKELYDLKRINVKYTNKNVYIVMKNIKSYMIGFQDKYIYIQYIQLYTLSTTLTTDYFMFVYIWLFNKGDCFFFLFILFFANEYFYQKRPGTLYIFAKKLIYNRFVYFSQFCFQNQQIHSRNWRKKRKKKRKKKE